MNRRNFVHQVGLLSAASLLPLPALASPKAQSYKLGLQLFSVNDDMNNDPIGTLKAVKAMGYQDFEIYGFDGNKGTYYGIPAAEFRMRLDDMGLSVSSGHYRFSDLFGESEDKMKRFVDQIIGGTKALGADYIAWPWLAPELRNIESFKVLAGKLNRIGEQVTAAGLGFAYHNHGYEFYEENGTSGYDIILSDTDPELVKIQLDMYWLMYEGKITPKQLIENQPGRVVMWHIKDMDTLTRDYTELGNGSINYINTLPDPEKSGLEYYYIEQGGNFAHSPLRSAADSAAYFKKYLQDQL